MNTDTLIDLVCSGELSCGYSAGYCYGAYNVDIHAHASVDTHNSSLHSAVAEGSYEYGVNLSS